MNEIRKKTKVCLDEKVAVVNNKEENTTGQTVSTAVATDFSAPNTGFNNASAFGGLAFIVLAVLILATVIVVKSGKKLKGLFVTIFMILAMFAPSFVGPRANAEECAKWGWSKYDVIAKIDLSGYGLENIEKKFEGTGEFNDDKKMVQDWVDSQSDSIKERYAMANPNQFIDDIQYAINFPDKNSEDQVFIYNALLGVGATGP